MSISNEEAAKRITELSDNITEFLSQECLKHGYSGSELYIGVKYFLNRLAQVLGPEAVRSIEKSFIIVNPKDYKDVV